ncbi:MAG: hypothetical protein NT062_02840 [Proteobacteria bacterium]|nr:hypothetical protein [Pseudomonadota bacterium]
MRTFLVASTAFAASLSSLLFSGCGCSAWNGVGDAAYRRGDDMALVCSNGGFTTRIGERELEGRLEGTRVIDGATGGYAYDLVHDGATLRSSALGDGWTAVELDAVELDHADVLCQDLTTRAWWAASATFTTATALVAPAAPTCHDDACLDVALFCPDGSATWLPADGKPTVGTYQIVAGELAMRGTDQPLAGLFRANGSLTPAGARDRQTTWTTRSVDRLGLACE